MTTLTSFLSDSLLKIQNAISKYNLSEFLISSFVYVTLSVVAMSVAFAYGLNAESRPIIVFASFNGLCSLGMFLFLLWMSAKGLPDRYYSWVSSLNYLAAFSLVPYVFYFLDKSTSPLLTVVYLLMNVLNFCLLLHILNFRIHTHYAWNDLRTLTSKRNGFHFQLSTGSKLLVLMPIGLVTIYFDKIKFDKAEYDLYDLSQYFKQHGLDLNTITEDDLLLWDMIKY